MQLASYDKRNRAKIRARVRAYYAAHPEKYEERLERQRERRRRDPEAFRGLHYRNHGLPRPLRPRPQLCECCGKPQPSRALALDHDHTTGAFRGWLCMKCNTGIGAIGDDLTALKRAAAYLERATMLMTDAELARCLDRVDLIEQWCKLVRAEALRRAMAGQEIPGYKLIEGRAGPRKWIDASVAEMILSDVLGTDLAHTKPTVISPTEAEKRLKAEGRKYDEVAALVERSLGTPSLARWDDVGKPLPRAEFGLEVVT